jgi:hypothetical protein
MKLKIRDVRREYQYTDAKTREVAKAVIEDSRHFIRALTDDD